MPISVFPKNIKLYKYTINMLHIVNIENKATDIDLHLQESLYF